MHAARIGITRPPHFLAGEHQHRRSITNQRVEQDVEHAAIRAAGVGAEGRGGAEVAVEDVLADIEVEGREVFVAEIRSEEHTSELQSLMCISYAVFCLKKKRKT